MAERSTHGRGKFEINTRVPTPTRTARRSVKCDFKILYLPLEYTRLYLCVYIYREREQIYRDDRFYRKLYSSWIRVGRYIAAVQAAVTLVEDISYNPC